ncbi:HAMP domain-containing histidine kinase [Sphingobacteriaceae bacterium WQ 2009]|uniref:histidine kinase n=1 Tax=Rhinopithecimicrobium faecis TaxID=2820698 RepID=A0A8T4HD53_9SPHI|nr:HAMP domain-containing histidine kinase [Sphingobacteriaceae bacterium WQ 2009]
MKISKYTYRKNIGLLTAFVALVTILFVVAVFFAKSLFVRYIENEFSNRKSEIFDQSLEPFNNLFHNKIPEISFYQGYLDSLEGERYAHNILLSFPFVKKVVFYDMLFTNDQNLQYGFSINNLLIHPKNLFIYRLKNGKLTVERLQRGTRIAEYSEELNNMGVRIASYIDKVNPGTKLSDADIFKLFYAVNPGKISYLNIPRMSDLQQYNEVMTGKIGHIASYEQDMFAFEIDPTLIEIKNSYPNLYQKIEIKPVISTTKINLQNYLVTEVALPGALSDYKIELLSSREFIQHETNQQFLPVVLGISMIYLILLIIVYLIYRNLDINGRLFKLQYDFINNLTHEFKTPVSVIKIAGNNIGSAKKLSEEDQQMYGRILDQEADKLNNLMNKLLSFTQIENKAIKLNLESINLPEFCTPIFIASKLKYTDMELSYDIHVQQDLKADPVLLNSVFQNLIDNAYKYSMAGSKELRITIQQNKRFFVIKFIDRGIGIQRNEYLNIFKKFYRIKSQYNQQGSIGLGLAFCKEITEYMGGEITVSSEVNVGTTFKLVFPVDK